MSKEIVPSFDEQRRQQQSGREAANNAVTAAEAIADDWPEHQDMLTRQLVRVLERWTVRLRRVIRPVSWRGLTRTVFYTRWMRHVLVWHPRAWRSRAQVALLRRRVNWQLNLFGGRAGPWQSVLAAILIVAIVLVLFLGLLYLYLTTLQNGP